MERSLREAQGFGARLVSNYDPRLDSPDVIVRQQAEIEALRTALVASNSESDGEYDRLRAEIECLRASHAGQLRNTLAFKAERDGLWKAASALILDVRRRYPGETLRCEYMRALDAALSSAQRTSNHPEGGK